MAGFSYGSEGSADQSGKHLDPPSVRDLPDASLLEKVLQETLSAGGDVGAIDAQTLAAVREVARRHPGTALDQQPVACDLIYAVLRTRFNGLKVSDVFWQTAAEQLSTTMMNDPQISQRLTAFWQKVGEEAA